MASGTIKAVVPKSDIVDNLTTNDSTKVLSAAQGYALNSKITNSVLLWSGDIHAFDDQFSLSQAYTNFKNLMFVENVIPSRTPSYDVVGCVFPVMLIQTGIAINIDSYATKTSIAIYFSSTTGGKIASYNKDSSQTYTPGIVKIYGLYT